MRRTIAGNGDGAWINLGVVEGRIRDASTTPLRVRHENLVDRRTDSPRYHVLTPRRGNTRVDFKNHPTAPQPEDAFEARPVHPSSRTGIPRPARTGGVEAVRAHVAGDDVRFGPIALEC